MTETLDVRAISNALLGFPQGDTEAGLYHYALKKVKVRENYILVRLDSQKVKVSLAGQVYNFLSLLLSGSLAGLTDSQRQRGSRKLPS